MSKDIDGYSGSDDVPPESGEPLPSRQLVSADSAIDEVSEPVEDLGGDSTDLTPGGEVTASTVSRFMTFYPFTRFFCWVAHKQFPSSDHPETRVRRLRKEQRIFYIACLLCDFLLVFIAASLLLIAATVVLYKTIWLGIA